VKKAFACALALGAVLVAATAEPVPARPILDAIDDLRATTWHWQRVMGKEVTPTAYSERRVESPRYRTWVLRLWRERAARVWRRARRPPHRTQWLCLQRYEGHWRSYPGGPGVLNSGGPYYGGLQMDLSFQRRYGLYLLRRKGTANRWSPLEQMWVAERAHRERGFAPWPNTARTCGLL
jgi:hypothetical protein